MFAQKDKIKFGQVWIAVKDYLIDEQWSLQKGSVIPKEARVVVVAPPPWRKKIFGILILNSKGLDERLSPNLAKMEEEKEGFGVDVVMGKFEDCFVLDENQSIAFDSQDTATFWKTILAHTSSDEGKDALARTV